MEVNVYIQEYSRLLFSNEQKSILALNYLKDNRGLTEDTIKFFEIGYCGEKSEVPGVTKEEKYLNRILNGKIVVPICQSGSARRETVLLQCGAAEDRNGGRQPRAGIRDHQ